MKTAKLTNGILIMMLLAGLSLLLYPSVSNYWNSFHQSRAIANYEEAVAKMDNTDYSAFWNAAVDYNKTLTERGFSFDLNPEQRKQYNELLNLADDGIMAYVEIPTIKCHLPIYHGTDESVLAVAVGHLEWSSLPVGGESSHCVVSGHRGLPSAKLFSDLNHVAEGDLFMLHVLDETLTYVVDQILIVEPDEVETLEIEAGKDLCTLVTCTPYGINSHRLLVRGHRTDNVEISVERRVAADAVQVEPMLVAVVLIGPAILCGIILIFVFDRGTNRRKKS